MRILDKIKSMFRQEEDEKAEEVLEERTGPIDIDTLLSKKNDEIKNLIGDKKKILLGELSVFLGKLEEDIRKLSLVNLDKMKANEKLRKITEQGKEDYVVSLNKFMGYLGDLTKENEKYEVGKINGKLEEFSKTSFKSYHKATVLIGKEMEKIKEDIITIRKFEDDFTKNTSELIKKEKDIENLMRKNDEKKNSEELRDKIIGDLKNIEKTHKNDQNELGAIEDKINEIKKSFEYKERERLENGKNEKEKNLEEIESELKILLDRRILEKYVHLNSEDVYAKFAQQYIDNPSKALLSDDKLMVVGVLADIRKNLKDGSIISKDSDKAVKKINVEKEIFLQHQSNLLRLDKEVEKINVDLGEIKVDFGNLLNEKVKIEGKITEDKNEIETLSKKKNRLDKEVLELDAGLEDAVSGL